MKEIYEILFDNIVHIRAHILSKVHVMLNSDKIPYKFCMEN